MLQEDNEDHFLYGSILSGNTSDISGKARILLEAIIVLLSLSSFMPCKISSLSVKAVKVRVLNADAGKGSSL